MKTILVASTAAAALFAAPAFAQTGSVGVSYSNPNMEAGGQEVATDNVSLDGSVALQANDWTVTLVGDLNHSKVLGYEDTAGSAAAHLTKMWTSDVRAGGFVAADSLGTGNTAWTYGAEAQMYLDRATLTGVVAYTDANSFSTEATTVAADAAYYVLPNLRLNAGITYNDVKVAGSSENAWTYGVSGEYQIAETPFSVTAGYAYTDFADLDINTLSIGVRYSFGGDLQARDRAGANLGNVNMGVANTASSFFGL